MPAQAGDADVVDTEEPPTLLSPDEESSAGLLLQQGLAYFRRARNAAAARCFARAIGTGHLNEAGRALAYWHIFVAERTGGRMDESHEALASFVVVAENVLRLRDDDRFAQDHTGDFVDRFDLRRRLAQGRAVLSAAWADRSRYFGRSAGNPVPVHDRDELRYFLDLVPTCADARQRRFVAAARLTDGAAGEETSEHFSISCEDDDRDTYVEYHFELRQ